MNNITSISIGILLAVLIGGFVFWQKDSSPAPVNTEAAVQGSATTTTRSITSAEVAAHASRGSCWSAINGNVYDLTSWIPEHPGGEEAILKLCGTDGSAKYNGKHGDAPKQAATLLGFKIGVVAQ